MDGSAGWAGIVAFVAGAIALVAAAAAITLAIAARRGRRRLRRMIDDVRIVASSNPSHRVAELGGGDERALAAAINALADRHATLDADVRAREAAARAGAEAERERLSAIVSQLSQAVLVCRGDGEIVLYNDSARRLLDAPGVAGAPALALGRSLHDWIDRHLIEHALAMLDQRATRDGGTVRAAFVTTTRAGRLLRVRVAPLDGGLALTLDDVTAPIETARRTDALVTTLTAEGRSALGNLRTAIETLREFPDLDASHQATLVDIVIEEATRLGDRLTATEADYATLVTGQWAFEDILVDDLLGAAAGRIRSRLALPCRIDGGCGDAWVRIDSFAIVQALSALASRAKMQCEATGFELGGRLDRNRFVHVELRWTGAVVDADTWRGWESQSLRLGGEANPLSLKAIVSRHSGESWLAGDGEAGARAVRLVLPGSRGQPSGEALPVDEGTRSNLVRFDRPEGDGSAGAIGSRRLDSLAFTVIDIATGPSATSISALAAVRVIGGRIAPAERIFLESTGDDGLPGDTALPALHALSRDTVLVTASPAGLGWLRANQSRTGTRFDGPALDLARLFSAAYPGLGALSWRDIASRIGVAADARRGGDAAAQAIAEALIRLLPALEARGITTLDDGLRAAEATTGH